MTKAEELVSIGDRVFLISTARHFPPTPNQHWVLKLHS